MALNAPTAPTRRKGDVTADSVRLWAYALIALQVLVRGFVVFPSYFFQDDYAHLEMARRLGLSSDFLVRDYGGHLEIGQYAVIWLVSHVIDISFGPAALTIVLLQLWASVLLFWVLRELCGNKPLILLPLAVYLFTPLSLAWATWWSAAMQTLPLQIAMLSVIYCIARLYRTGERRWAWWSIVAHLMGLLFWEKAALILPVAIAVVVLIVAPSMNLRNPVTALRAHWRTWIVHAVVLGGYVALYLNLVESPVDGSGGSSASRLLTETIGRMFIPGIFGGPWHANGAENTLYPYADTFPALLCAALFAGLLVASIVVNGRRALCAWALLAGYLAVDLTLLGMGRADWIGILARDPRYVADALPITAIALSAAFLRREGGDARNRADASLRARATLPTVMKGVAVVVVSCLITTFKLAPVAQHEYSENFAKGVLRQMSEHPERPVVSTTAPFVVSARTDIEQMMDAIGADLEFDSPTTEMYVFDGLANMRLMAPLPGKASAEGPEEGCGWAVGTEWTRIGSVPASWDPVRILRIGYLSDEVAELTIRVGEDEQQLELPAGFRRAYFVISTQGGALSVMSSGSEPICVVDWADGLPWAAE